MAYFNETEFHAHYKSFEDIQKRIARAGDILHLSKNEIAAASKPSMQILVNFTVTMNNRKQQHFEGFLIVANGAGNNIGGEITLSPELNLDAAKAIATALSLKAAFWECDFRGAHAGIVCEAEKLSPKEIGKAIKAFKLAIADVFIQNNYGALPSLQLAKTTTFIDGFPEIRFHHLWLVSLLNKKTKHTKERPASVVIYGFSEKDKARALALYNAGYKILAVGHQSTGYYSPYGIDVVNLVNFSKKQDGSIKAYPNAIPVAASRLLSYNTGILVIGEGALHLDTFKGIKINAGLIIEGAAHKIPFYIDQWLSDNNIELMPDALANGYDYLQRNSTQNNEEDEDITSIISVLDQKAEQLFSVMEEHQTTSRLAAYIIALKKKHNETILMKPLNEKFNKCA